MAADDTDAHDMAIAYIPTTLAEAQNCWQGRQALQPPETRPSPILHYYTAVQVSVQTRSSQPP